MGKGEARKYMENSAKRITTTCWDCGKISAVSMRVAHLPDSISTTSSLAAQGGHPAGWESSMMQGIGDHVAF